VHIPARLTPLLVACLAGSAPSLPAQAEAGGIQPLIGGRLGVPTKGSFWLGFAKTARFGHHGDYRGPAIVLEPGLGGGQLSLGLAAGSPWGGSARAQLSLFRSWGESVKVAPGQTFLGAELLFMPLHIGLGASAYRRVSGDTPGDTWFAGLSFAVGF